MIIIEFINYLQIIVYFIRIESLYESKKDEVHRSSLDDNFGKFNLVFLLHPGLQ